MGLGNFKQLPFKKLGKYKYVALIIVIGIILMALPIQKDGKNDQEKSLSPRMTEQTIEQELEEILSQVDGAGKVRVYLQELYGAQTIYQTNTDSDQSDASVQNKEQCVVITDQDRNERGLVKQVIAPQYQGAIIVCQGADDPIVKLAVAEAVSKATGLGMNKISILKMNGGGNL